MTRAELKESAKKSLNGHVFEFFKMVAVFFLICFAVGFVLGFGGGFAGLNEKHVELLAEIIGIVISCLFGFGMTNFYLKLSRNENVTWKELFSKTNMFGSYLLITLLVSVLVSLGAFLLIIPGIILAMAYSMVYYVKLDNPELGVLEVLGKSSRMMKGHKMDYFILNLSFIGWEILGAFTLGILYIWLVPYMQVTICKFYDSIKQ